MKHTTPVVLALALICWLAPRSSAQDGHAAPSGAAAEHPSAEHSSAEHSSASAEGAPHAAGAHETGPVVPGLRQRWPAVAVIVILAMFLAAAVIGPIVRAQAPPEMPPTHSHDEPPGASHHHGHTGTINPVPEDVARVEEGHGHDHH